MVVSYKSTDFHISLSTYLTAQDTFVIVKLSPLLTELYPVMIAIVTPVQYQTRQFPCSLLRHAHATPPRLKLVGLKSSGQRLILWNGKTKRIALFFSFFSKHFFFFKTFFVVVALFEIFRVVDYYSTTRKAD